MSVALSLIIANRVTKASRGIRYVLLVVWLKCGKETGAISNVTEQKQGQRGLFE